MKINTTFIQKGLAFFCALTVTSVVWALEPTVKTPQVDTPKRLLMIGNSYLYYGDSLHNVLRNIVIADNPDVSKSLQYKSATIGGSSLDHHNIDWLTKPGQIGVKEPFELVILQGHSAAAINEKQGETHAKAAQQAATLIAERGGKVALYMPHSYVAPHKQAAPENVQKNRDYYVKLGNELNALVIPVGLAFAEAYKRDPALKLHKSYDGSHPSRDGTYLAAATVYAALYGRSPVGNTFDAFGEVDPKTRLLLQQVAWDTVKQFYGR
ncbi:hypothetical protein [Zwartia sp.]|uniref:hypothetical protein n=1 Tax=Zwartia sp. TaxID=2978004 RepID=UPI00271769A9|nr:hypothetical protein [Zwartia sp.]MDO9023670.1 hypothetical protein [Zwartia sp.]